jgi:hypothetical protein
MSIHGRVKRVSEQDGRKEAQIADDGAGGAGDADDDAAEADDAPGQEEQQEEDLNFEALPMAPRDEPQDVARSVRRSRVYFFIPVRDKKASTGLECIQTVIAKLANEGVAIKRFHSDRGTELFNSQSRRWLLSRGVLPTTTIGDDPQSNGRAEAAVGLAKRRVRTLLHASKFVEGFDAKALWPHAATMAAEIEWAAAFNKTPPKLAFGASVAVRVKEFERRDALDARMHKGRYLGPVPLTNGHGAMMDDGVYTTASTMNRIELPDATRIEGPDASNRRGDRAAA